MKRNIAYLMLIIISISISAANKQDMMYFETKDFKYSYPVDENEIIYINEYKWPKCETNIIIRIPDTVMVDGKARKVTRVCKEAFMGCRYIQEIHFGVNISIIEDYAFADCSRIQYVYLAHVASIGKAAFMHCSKLNEITIPQSCYSIGSSAFFGCTELKSVYIPESVVMIGEGAFAKCPNISSMVVSINNKAYDSRENCNAIIQTDINTIVSGCKETIFPKSTKAIAPQAFNGCNISTLIIPSYIKEIGHMAFANCNKLESLIIEHGCKTLNARAFAGCKNLNSVALPNGIAIIGSECFAKCPNINHVTIGRGLKSFGYCVFDEVVCDNAIVRIPKRKQWDYALIEGVGHSCRNFFSTIKKIEEY